MRWYNAAMSKPFQFSIRRMLFAIASLCVAAFLLEMPFRFGIDGYAAIFLWISAGAVAGAGTASLFHKWWIGAAGGAILAGLSTMIWIYLTVTC
jgi:hypothetical protein